MGILRAWSPPDRRGRTSASRCCSVSEGRDGSGRLLRERRRDDVEDCAVALQSHALRVELHPARSPQLLAAARVARPAVDELREHGARAEGLTRNLLAPEVDPPVVRRDREDELAQEIPVVAEDGADEAATAAPHQP